MPVDDQRANAERPEQIPAVTLGGSARGRALGDSEKARVLELISAAVLVVMMIPVGYPWWTLAPVALLGAVGILAKQLLIVRRAFWVAIVASYATLVTFTLFPYPWQFRWLCCFIMAGGATSLFYWAVEK